MPEPGTGELITNAAPGIVGSHDVILQSLDSWRPYVRDDGKTDSLYYPSDKFRGTETAWETVPVILGKRHPKTPFSVDPAKALEEAEGAVVGNLSQVYITNSGTPLLRSKLNLSDNSAESLLKSRKMALSSGFVTGINDGYVTGMNGGTVIPDHVLAFEQTRTKRPQDGAALILNGIGGEMPENEDSIKKVLSEFLADLKSLLVPAKTEPVMPAMPEPKGMVSNMTETKIAELEKTVTDQAELIKNMTAELDGFKQAESERKAADLEAKWSLVKNSTSPGLYATPELETTNRKEWETDPTAYLIKNAVNSKQEETKPEGVQFVKNGTSDDADAEYLQFLRGY